MTHRTDEAPRREIIARWCSLAEQRLDYLTEMFESGRWRRYYTEVAFLENIKEAKFAVDTWRNLSTPHLNQGMAAVEQALSSPHLQRGVAAVELALAEPAVPVPAAEPELVPIAPEAFDLADDIQEEAECASAEPGSQPVIDMLALEQALDIPEMALDMTAIEQRYPLLRNAL